MFPTRPRIDAHHHVWDVRVRDQPWTDPFPVLHGSFPFDRLYPQLDKARIDGTVVVQTVASEAETRELLALAADEHRVWGVVGWFDLENPALRDRLAQARSLRGGDRLVGVRHQLQVEPDPRWLSRPGVRCGLRALADEGLVFDVVVSASGLPLVVDTVRALPEVEFVLDHAGKPDIASGRLGGWVDDIRRLAAQPNVSVKLSGLVTEADWAAWTAADLVPVATELFDSFGPERIMYGSDWPVCLLANADYAAVAEVAEQLLSPLNDGERDMVFGTTAERVYRLDAS